MNRSYLVALAIVALACDGGPVQSLPPGRADLLVYDGDDCIPDIDPGCAPYNPEEDQKARIRLALDEFNFNYIEPACRSIRDAGIRSTRQRAASNV